MFTNEEEFRVFLDAVTIDYIVENGLSPDVDWDSPKEVGLARFRAAITLHYSPEFCPARQHVLEEPNLKDETAEIFDETLPYSLVRRLAYFSELA